MNYIKSLLVLAIILFVPTVFASNNNQNNSIANSDEYKIIKSMKVDTTGDKGIENVLILADEENKGYIVKILHLNKNAYTLEPDKNFSCIAPYTPFWDLNMIIADINSDTMPEIVTWGDTTHENEIHIFRWNGTMYEIIYSGFYEGLEFEDINGDNIPELVIRNRIYGIGYEYMYYQWQNDKYNQIFYEFDSARGYDKIVSLLELIDRLPPEEPIFYDINILNNYFTEEWIKNEENLKALEKFNDDLLSIQIVDYVEDWEPSNGEESPKREIWPLIVKVLRLKNTKIESKELMMEVTMKYMDYPIESKWKIDDIKCIE
ncbi:hypothetical protein [Anaerosolibacter sp.]|uniref:hypothetical protein n=1 Tax=Anaerosolibacter sp. TaxID=1872527 RepID=UPI0039F124B0